MRPRRVLLTAFAPYDVWRENASQQVLEALVARPPADVELETRVYPVDYAGLSERIGEDLAGDFEWVLHLGQAPGRARLELEALARNVRSDGESGTEAGQVLVVGGAGRLWASVPVNDWSRRLTAAGIPAGVSFDAGSYLCNAALYTSLRLCAEGGLATRCGFLHVPLTPEQAADCAAAGAGVAPEIGARALRALLGSEGLEGP